jgi:large subunit ribosomal protein L27e
MGKKTVAKRSKCKPFVKFVNYQHMMPTRYAVDIDLKAALGEKSLDAPETRHAVRQAVKKEFEQRYLNQTAASGKDGKVSKKAEGVGYFFTKLRF